MTSTGTSKRIRAVAVVETAPQHDGRRNEIEHLHQRLRHQPRIAPQQHPFLAAQRATAATLCGTPLCGRVRLTAGMAARRPPRWHIRRSAARPARWRRPSSARLSGEHADQRNAVAQRGARRPPDHAAEIGRERQHGLRLQHGDARDRPVGQNGRHLQADDEGGADHRRDDLRDKPRALGTDERGTTRPSGRPRARSPQRPWRRSVRRRRASASRRARSAHR